MDWLTFIAEMTKALAWPLIIVIVLVFLRKPLLELIPLLKYLRYKDLELDFGKQVNELAAEFPQELSIKARDVQLDEHTIRLANLSPRAVILESWLRVEEAAIEASKRRGLKLTSREVKTPIVLGHALEEAGVLDKNKMEIYHRLRNLRNMAAHASEFSFDSDSALEYATLSLRLADYLENG
jgi:hypothetical protein